jgi:hypothetical protein
MSRFSMYVRPKGGDMHTDLINVPGGWAPLRCYTNTSFTWYVISTPRAREVTSNLAVGRKVKQVS